tara:strand:- start:909 stop:1565 length:657 start_codon:yes stop_codon:yes gene_type:complete
MGCIDMAIIQCDNRYSCPGCINCSLKAFVYNWGRGHEHIKQLHPTWVREFDTTPETVLKASVEQLIREYTDSFIPPIGKLIDIIKEKRGGSHVDKCYRKCPDCDTQGFRHVAVHYECAPQKYIHHFNQPHCVVMTVNCNCHFGSSRPGATLDQFIDKAERTLAETDRLRCYHVSERGMLLTREQTTLAEDYEQWLHKPRSKNNPFRKMISALSQGQGM